MIAAGTGGTVALGGGDERANLTIEPKLLVDPGPDSPVMAEEIFGRSCRCSHSLTEAFEFGRSRPKPLAAYLFSSSARAGERFLAEISSGGTLINHLAMHRLAPQLLFGGRNSGTGAYPGEWDFQTFSHRKAVLAKPARPDPRLPHPTPSGRRRSSATYCGRLHWDRRQRQGRMATVGGRDDPGLLGRRRRPIPGQRAGADGRM